MRRSFGPRIRNWCTFNEPGVYTFSGYFFGSFPPGKFFATRIAGLVVKHMLIAHERAYKLIKSLPGAPCCPECRVPESELVLLMRLVHGFLAGQLLTPSVCKTSVISTMCRRGRF